MAENAGALEALRRIAAYWNVEEAMARELEIVRAALSPSTVEREPVVWMIESLDPSNPWRAFNNDGFDSTIWKRPYHIVPLYAAPPVEREPVSLRQIGARVRRVYDEEGWRDRDSSPHHHR